MEGRDTGRAQGRLPGFQQEGRCGDHSRGHTQVSRQGAGGEVRRAGGEGELGPRCGPAQGGLARPRVISGHPNPSAPQRDSYLTPPSPPPPLSLRFYSFSFHVCFFLLLLITPVLCSSLVKALFLLHTLSYFY